MNWPKIFAGEAKSTCQASFDKAEITPMVDINSEENRVVFEGYIFM